MKKILLFAVTFSALFTSISFAQPGCPSVSTATSVTIPCGQTCTNLTATAFAGAQTTAYSVTTIPYSPPFPFNTGTQILVNTDDIWSGVISLPFHFCFFGNNYNQIIVGSNGICSFNTTNAGAFNNWNIPGVIPSATPADLTNSIMGPWQDIDPTNQGQVYYEIGGTYPCRYFKVSWYNVPYYGDPQSVNTSHCQGQDLRATQQIILYETTNVIEMYIQSKQICSDWNGGLATQGIQNANGTVAYTVTGRNASQWTASNDAKRFTPAGAPNYTIAWFQGSTQIGTGNTINVCPPTTTTYTAQATYTDCDASTIVVTSNVQVTFSGTSASIDSVHQISCAGGSDGAVYASYNVGSAILSYGWSPGGQGQTHLDGLPAGTYIFSVTDAASCTRYDTVTLVDPPQLVVNVPDTTLISCSGNPTTSLTANTSGGTPGYTYSWTGGAVTQTITGVGAGTYNVTVSDSKLCTATDAGTVSVVSSSPTFNPPVITDATCAASNGSIVVSLTGAVDPITYTWDNSLPNNDTVTGLAGGTYSVTATDANGCSATASYTVGQTGAVTLGTPIIEDASCAGNDGNIIVVVNGATPTVHYTWSGSLPDSDTQSGLAAGSYCVTATDANGCSASACYTVGQAAPITFGTPVITDATCTASNGTMVVTVNGATDPITYTWTNSLPDNDTVTGLAAGTYSVTATDVNGCSTTASYTVGQTGSISFGTPAITNASCSASNGSIAVVVIGGTNPITYTWTNSLPDNDTVFGLAAGTYSVTATDANGCSATASYTVGQGATFTFGAPVITNANCGGSNGSIVVTTVGATDPITYTWTNSLPDNDTVTGLASGSYSVTATDANGCSATATYNVGQGQSFTLGTPVITNATCAGNDGSIVVTTNGATDPITYTWTNSLPNNDTVTGLAVGTYSVTVTDANGCSATASYNIGQGSSIVITNSQVSNVSCTGAGTIIITATGGTGTLTYSWSSNTGTFSGNPLTGIAAGSYTLTITDQASCSATANFIVGQSICGDCPAVSTNNNATITCGQSCTTLHATAVAGAQTTAYTGATIAYNPAAYNQGTQILVATDDIFSGVINLPFNFCFFGNTYGQLIVGSNGIVSFNAPPTFNNNSWQINGPIPSATPADLTNSIMGPWQDLDPTNQGLIYESVDGTYPCRRFVVSWYQVPMFGDPNSVSTGDCPNPIFQTQQIVLYETTNVIDIYIQAKDHCTGWNSGLAIEGIQNAAGTVAYTVPGRNATVWDATNDGYRFTPAGAPNYVINWYQGTTQIGTGDSISVCPSATTTYNVQAVYTNCDNSTVTVSDSVLVTVQGGLTATVDSVTNVTCHGGNNGAVYASYTTTGTISSFGWAPGGAGQTSLTNIPAGTYIFTATTTTGCTISDTAIVTEPSAIVVTVPDTTLYNCTAASVSACLTASATGGTPGYTFDWGGQVTTATNCGLPVGTYTVTVTDTNSCTATGSGSVIQIIANPTLTAVVTNITCNGAGDGSIAVSVTQATPVVNYQWSPSEPNNDTIINLGAGTYAVTATDANGCSTTASYDITEPAAIVIGTPTITDATCTVGGTITVTATGGTGTLTYGWSNNQTGNSIDSLAAGPYTLTVTDANNCSATASYTVNAATGTVAFGNPTIVDVTCNGGANGSITATATGGTGTITFTWSTNPTQNGATASGLSAGPYSVTISDANGCSASTTYTVNEPTAITFTQASITAATCLVGGTVSEEALGGTGNLIYTWSNGDTGITADSLPGGPVTLTVTDANGCSATATYTVPSQNTVSFGNSIVTQITCHDANNGSIHVVVASGTEPIVYVWNPLATSTDSIATGLAQGSYSVTVTDAGGCSASTTFNITNPAALTIVSSTVVDATCSAGGSISVTVSGGTGTLNYAWSNTNQTGSSITNLSANTYVLTVTDANLCSITASYTVAGATGSVTLGTPIINNVSCHGLNNGSITATATGSGNINFAWNTVPPQVGATITGLAPGSYTVIATAGGACADTATYTITEPTAISASINATTVLCLGSTNGTATVTATGGTGNYSYHWNNDSTTATIGGLEPGIVVVTVTDANGCTATASTIINQSPPLSYNSQVNQPNCADLGFGTEILTPRGGTGAITIVITGLPVDTTLSMVGADTVLTQPGVPTGCYTFTLTDAVGCTASGNFCVQAGAANESFDIHADSTSCYGDRYNNGAITITPLASANAPYTYSFNGGAFQSDSAFTSLTAGSYTIVTKNTYGCLDTLTAVVPQPAQVFVNASPDTIITAPNVGNQVTVDAQNFVNPVFNWSPVTGLVCEDSLQCSNATITVDQSTVYYIVVNEASDKTCAASDSIVIIVTGDLVMPNAFSPNGDGKNDTYGPVHGDKSAFVVTDFRIYNRWGQLVHNTPENWDGKLSGKDQPADTYIYYIAGKTPDPAHPGSDKTEMAQGAFTLLR